ncbi:MAG: hypothetical protein Q9167_000413 [Letrouitia subvulpina]
MPPRERLRVDDSYDIHPDENLTSLIGGERRPRSYGTQSPTPGSRTTIQDPLEPSHEAEVDAEEEAELKDVHRTEPSTLSANEPLPTDGLPTIRHVDQGGRILKISFLKQSHGRYGRQRVDSQSQGLFLVSSSSTGEVAVDVIFVYEIFGGGSHPYYDWLNEKAPSGDDYLPDDVEAFIPLARVWAYGYQSVFDDKTPVSSAANNFLVYYGEQRQRDRRNNPSVDDAAVPKLIFICVGIGGIVVKKSRSSMQKSIAKSCQGIVFIGTPHLPEQKKLAALSSVMRFYPKSFLRSIDSGSFPNFDALLKELQIVNREFLSWFTEMPSTFCVVNLRKTQNLYSGNTLFPSEIRRRDRDEYLSVTQSKTFWRTLLHKDHPTFIAIMTHLRGWARMGTLPLSPTVTPPREEHVTGGVNLLSVDGGGVRGLASLLVIERIMREIARKEVAMDPSTSQNLRIPADYFDLAGGTSTGG